MSTAGKVLVVLILLASCAWIVLAAGVDQLSRNGNEALAKAAADLLKAQEALEQSKADMVRLKDETTVAGEAGDQRLAVLSSQKNDVERSATTIRDIANKLQFQLETAQATVKQAEQSKQLRTTEKNEETKALADARAEVESLMAKNNELTSRLQLLRKEFKDVFDKNVQMVASSRR
jgi:chromosome segregation ATPase